MEQQWLYEPLSSDFARNYCEIAILFSSNPSLEMGMQVLKDAGKAAGIETEASPHTLRHSMATLLLEKGYTLTDVGKRLGHAWYGSTLRYVHSYNSAQDKMVETLNNLSKDSKKS